jgi:anti-sigma28 factor (negative regulator of flagellin synthesis)
MRIENGNLNGVANSGSSGSLESIGSDRRVSAGDADPSSSDSVQLSGASGLIALARSVGSGDRQVRLGNLTAQVQSGNYQVDSQKVSQAILESLN